MSTNVYNEIYQYSESINSFLYKVKFFNNKINAGIELNSGDNINFENVKDLNETEFFKLPIKGKGHKMRMRKLKKEFLVEKKKLG